MQKLTLWRGVVTKEAHLALLFSFSLDRAHCDVDIGFWQSDDREKIDGRTTRLLFKSEFYHDNV